MLILTTFFTLLHIFKKQSPPSMMENNQIGSILIVSLKNKDRFLKVFFLFIYFVTKEIFFNCLFIYI